MDNLPEELFHALGGARGLPVLVMDCSTVSAGNGFRLIGSVSPAYHQSDVHLQPERAHVWFV